ncbi:MAG TPA: SAM-dependent methyltransferase [Clostridiaceae bacterium]|jgi:23S rRNA (cytosine1962-C5)-methyltransferase|nr:SAM-dependent methyltransferase [Clostridiaceae bacterium]
MLLADDWKDYELIDTGGGEKLERWGNVVLRRPDPQVIWPIARETENWKKADARYIRSSSGGGHWEYKRELPGSWTIRYGKLRFIVHPTDFKHTGLFPEQAVNWKWIIENISKANRKVSVLNLFAYTGGATVAAASAGAQVCHVDAAKGMVSWAKENLKASGLEDKPVRLIVDDVLKFVLREQRRGHTYDGIIMDPPSYGRGPKGEVWKIEESLYGLIEECVKLLSPKPVFFLINSYTTGFSPYVLSNILKMALAKAGLYGNFDCGEVGIPVTSTGLVLPCGIYGRVTWPV